MLYSEIIAVCSQIHTKHINTLCGQNVELLNVKHCGMYIDRWDLGGLMRRNGPTMHRISFFHVAARTQYTRSCHRNIYKD